MSNLTGEMKNLYVQNAFKNKTIEEAKREMVILQDRYDFDIRSMAEGKIESNSSLFNELYTTNERILDSNYDVENDAVALTPQDLTDLAVSACEMKFYRSAIKFLREGVWLLGE